VVADKLIDEDLANCELIVIPGGQPGANNLKKNNLVTQGLKNAFERGNKIASICAGPIVLDEAGILNSKDFVSFPGTEEEINSGNRLAHAIVVKDGNLITARGAGAAFEFGLALIDFLGEDAEAISESTQYKNVIDHYKQG
jgi:4-methyl-5(b-hydroxyethyl)-thiazole monophosphate biosynthesis